MLATACRSSLLAVAPFTFQDFSRYILNLYCFLRIATALSCSVRLCNRSASRLSVLPTSMRSCCGHLQLIWPAIEVININFNNIFRLLWCHLRLFIYLLVCFGVILQCYCLCCCCACLCTAFSTTYCGQKVLEFNACVCVCG